MWIYPKVDSDRGVLTGAGEVVNVRTHLLTAAPVFGDLTAVRPVRLQHL